MKDTSEVVFDDLPEDHPQYEAGRFLFDYGYLEPVSDTEFGIDEPVSMNELLGVMYYEFGGENDPDTAYDLFSQMGLIGATVDREGVATELDAIGLINGVLAMSGETWSFEADETPLTRGRLGEILIQFEDEFAE